MAANITVGEAAFLAETLLSYLAVNELGSRGSPRMGAAIRALFRRWTHPISDSWQQVIAGRDFVDWQAVVEDIVRPLILDAVARARRPEEYDRPL